MSWDWVALIGIVLIGVLLIVFRNNAFVKKNWKYALILIPLIIFIILKIMSGLKAKDNGGGSSSPTPTKDNELEKNIENLKDRLVEVQMETAAEIIVAKTKNEETIKQLEEVKKIEDKSERRKRLAQMIG